jgi:UDP-glucose 4-epimerase
MACVTGGCGFIGSHLVRRLVADGWAVRVLDNLSVGTAQAVSGFDRATLIEGDIRDEAAVTAAVNGCEVVFHFAAPTDVRAALENPRHDIDHGVLGTQTVLEGMRRHEVNRLVFASSSCVYGSGLNQPVSEAMGPLLPDSIYGAGKLAAEGLIAAYCGTFGIQSWMFRFPNVVGPGVTHGVIFDFVRRLAQDPTHLRIYGDGTQTKTYLRVEDCVSGIFSLIDRTSSDVNVLNVTTRGATSVRRIAELVVEALELGRIEFQFTGGDRGWAGDVPIIRLDPSRAAALGWTAQLDSEEAVRRTIMELREAGSCPPSS